MRQCVHAQTDKAETVPIQHTYMWTPLHAVWMDLTSEQVTDHIGSKDIAVRVRNKRATVLNKVSNHKQDATPKPKFLVNQASIAQNNGFADDAGPHRIQCPWWMCIDLQ